MRDSKEQWQRTYGDKYRNKTQSIINSKNGRWVSGEYVNGKSLIDVQCSEGHIWTTRIEYINQGKWCAVCAKEATALITKKAWLLKRINRRIEYTKTPEYRRNRVNKQIYHAHMRMYKTDSHKEYMRERRRLESKRHYYNNRDKRREDYRVRYATDMVFQMNERLGRQLRKCLVKDRRMGKYYELFGYTARQFKDHIESLFIDGMCWDRIDEIHIDHRRPKSWYVLTNDDGSINHEEVIKCWALSNLQPLWATDNIVKGNRWEG